MSQQDTVRAQLLSHHSFRNRSHQPVQLEQPYFKHEQQKRGDLREPSALFVGTGLFLGLVWSGGFYLPFCVVGGLVGGAGMGNRRSC